MACDEELNIVVGAFDRHNFGDLLFAHLAAQEQEGGEWVFAGLAERDMQPFGGHRVAALADLARRVGDRPVRILHAGGELLDCDAWEAAIMTREPGEARSVIARLDADAAARLAWARETNRLDGLVPYCVPRSLFRNAVHVEYRAVGGVGLPRRPEAHRREVLARLGEADRISVRDCVTLDWVRQAGVEADRVPDPVAFLPTNLLSRIGEHGGGEALAALRAALPGGYMAVQFRADFGDDATLSMLARQFDEVVVGAGCGLALFRAGAAPWHDDLETYRRLLSMMNTRQAVLFESLHVWDICALIASARAYCGSSLHGRLVAEAHGVPGVSLLPRATRCPARCRPIGRPGIRRTWIPWRRWVKSLPVYWQGFNNRCSTGNAWGPGRDRSSHRPRRSRRT